MLLVNLLFYKLEICKLCFVLVIITTGYSRGLATRPWSTLTINGKVDNLITDDEDNSIILVANSDIYKYSSDLNLLTSTISSTSSKVTSNKTDQSDLVNKVLLVMRKNDPDVLFSCWQRKDLNFNCLLYKLNDLKSVSPLLWPAESKGFKTGPSDQIKALGNQLDAHRLLLVTSREYLENSSQVPYLPSVGKFRISKSQPPLPKQLILEPTSVLPELKKSANNIITSQFYIYLFDYLNSTHIILNEDQKPASTSTNKDIHRKVKLARICHNDNELTSYTEISLTCNRESNLDAKVAYFDSTKEEPTLYIVYDKSQLCAYSMKLIDDIFQKVVSDCNNGDQNSNLLSKFYPDSTNPPVCQRNPSAADWCTSGYNPYIDGSSHTRYSFSEDTYLILRGLAKINFILTTRQGNKDVLFVGTESGLLTKMSSDEDLFYTVDLNHDTVISYRLGDKFSTKITYNETDKYQPTRYVTNSRDILALTGTGTIHKLNIDECHYYQSCRSCLSSADPLKCVWCGESCSRVCHQSNPSNLTCPPIVKRVFPKSGPLTGQTRLKIEGEDFGSSKRSLVVKLDEFECAIDKDSSSEDTIECLTRPVDQPTNASISVSVSDEWGPIEINGLAIAPDTFNFVGVKVYGLYQVTETSSGSIQIGINGENLNVGANRSVLIGDLDCKIIKSSSDELTCIIKYSPKELAQTNGSYTNLGLKVYVDGSEQLRSPRSHHRDHNLSMNFSYSPKQTPTNNTSNAVIVDNLYSSDGGPLVFISMIAILIIASLAISYFLFKEKLSQIKIFAPFDWVSRSSSGFRDKIDDTGVAFKNPQSHKFSQSKFNLDGNTAIGLVKLNGSTMSSDYFGKQDQIDQDQPLMNNFLDSDLVSLLVQENILIDRNLLTLGHVLGSGQFGRVYKGFLKIKETGEHEAVAVKTLHNRSSWDDALDNRAFLEEGLMMKDFEHENVLALIGVTFDSNGLPMVITPFMLYGDLRSYTSDEASSPTVKELIDFGTQVAKGMAYLSGLKFVHRDLAARNCMLDDNLVVKVADFGLSRDIYERDYYSSDNKKTKLPVKWMAIESLEKCIYNTKTDVWSYGVLLWELMTRGVVPYPDVDNFDLFSYLKEGRRMLRPRYCPVILYKIMLSCWHEDPAERPTFDELVQKVSEVITQLKVAKDGLQKVSRDITYCDVLK